MEVALAKQRERSPFKLSPRHAPLGESLYSLDANVAAACDVHTITDTVF
jgi:hypothetical protein